MALKQKGWGITTPSFFIVFWAKKEAVSVMQGDSYYLGFSVLNNAKVPVTPNDIQDMEITIGHISKTYKNAQVIYSDGRWLFPLSQQETFGYWPKATKAQIRILWANGVLEGKPIHGVRVNESISKEVLG